MTLLLSEQLFQQWLESRKYGYVFIEQSIDTFATFFRGITKRPDYFIVLPSIGVIAVDVKERKYYKDYQNFTINETEVRKLTSFERTFKIPVWIAISNENIGFTTWYWISLDKIVENSPIRINSFSKEEFRTIPIKNCTTIGWNDNLGKLFLD
ncbi:MAG: hypothetical protein ACFFDH_14320 [Promethearchaeota archaeon]